MKTRNAKKMWLLAFAFPLCSFAQTTIIGAVVDENEQALKQVLIEELVTHQKTKTAENGRFTLSNLTGDSLRIRLQKVGFQTGIVPIKKQDTVYITIRLLQLSHNIEEIVITPTRASSQTPTTFSMVTKEQLAKINFGQDLPVLLETTPSAVSTSDAGAGVGYTGLRIRGVDPTRTNVTINGIPINDAESHAVYWVNMPDFASSVQDIQIQRGVGTSANGAAAFGASINIVTDQVSKNPYTIIDQSVGSFRTAKSTVKIGTGQLKNGFSFDARLSRITSAGYLDRASSNLNSYFLAGAWIGKKSSVKANFFSGKEITYQAWEGTPESRIKNDVAGMNAFADRNYLTDVQRQNLLNSGRTYNLYTYDNQVDNYRQDHFQLHFNHQFNARLNLQLAAHSTLGKGYYEQFRANDDLADYGLASVVLGNDSVTSSDLVRRKWLDNQFYGGIFALTYKTFRLNLTWGGALNTYSGVHFGEVIWARFASNSEIRHRYYNDDAQKSEVSSYVRVNYAFRKFSFYGDMQYRFIDYSYFGTSEVNGALQEGREQTTFSFFNPKAGLIYNFSTRTQVYGSLAVGNREPVRDDFRQPVGGVKPQSEQIANTELGFRHQSPRFLFKSNVYWMNYKNQLILTGQINDAGGYTRTNVAKSYRLGLELEAAYKLSEKLTVSGNVTLSQNKVAAFTAYMDDYDNGGQVATQFTNTDLAFSPNTIAALLLAYQPIKRVEIMWTAKYVGKQYLDNTSDETKRIDAYFVNHLGISYDYPINNSTTLKVSAQVNNIFNHTFENNGYTYSYFYGGATTTENFYYPQAGRNVMLRLSMSF
ncbi:MAG: TonB-dependent receptor [Fluviicola sp.]|nr:TonB-dependent receptor [Fluviicola sp.]MBP6271985.1 TonB-dependent receptor [Fluviicola sp.]